MKAKTRTKAFFFIFLLFVVGFFTGCSNATEPGLTNAELLVSRNSQRVQTLSDMSEQDCVEFIIQNGITIPDGFPNLGAFVKSNIQTAERYPDAAPVYSYDVTYYFAESIRALVNEYYGTAQRDPSVTRSIHIIEVLEDSLVYSTNLGAWSDHDGGWCPIWEKYNCYAYAIDRTEQPSEYASSFQYQPGDFAHTGSFYYDIPTYDLAMVVKDDLVELGLGYSDVCVSYAVPDTALLSSNQKLICIRTGDDDFHFMKYNDGYWYHKPSGTAILRYKFHPSDYIWKRENSANGIEYEGNTAYPYYKEIYYIVYYTEPFGGFIGGDGSENDPYLIKTERDLRHIHEVDSGTTYFKLASNIDLLTVSWAPLPNFLGILDGDEFTIFGLFAEQPNTSGGGLGLFEENSGTIKNLHISGQINVNTNNVTVGMIAGVNTGTIQNCETNSYDGSDVMVYNYYQNCRTGGITGVNYYGGIIDGCRNYGRVKSTDDYVGGITGHNEGGLITKSGNTGDVSSIGYYTGYYTGGIAGHNEFGTITESYNTGNVSSAMDYTGGIAGNNGGGTISKTWNTGNVYSLGYYYIGNYTGGIAGSNPYGCVSIAYNTGEVIGDYYTGGIVGYNYTGDIFNTYNTGNVFGRFAGGIAGLNMYGDVAYNYSTGSVSGNTNIGGIVGWHDYRNTGIVAINVSLNALSAEIAGARVFCGTGVSQNNKARSDMVLLIGGVPVGFSNIYGSDGLPTAIGTPLSSVFEFFDTSVWSIPYGNLTIYGSLPTLQGMLSRAQNPVLLPPEDRKPEDFAAKSRKFLGF